MDMRRRIDHTGRKASLPILLALGLLAPGNGAVAAATTPAGGAVAKRADFVIVPPWASGGHIVMCGYGCGEHDGTATAGSANDEHALDFDLALDEAVHPVAPGTVLYAADGTAGASGAGWQPYGKLVYIKHGDTGYTSLYAHLDSIDVTPGQAVTIATRLGGAGRSGTDEVHLHFALYEGASSEPGQQPYGGRAVVPEPFASCIGRCEDLAKDARLSRVADGGGSVPDRGPDDPGTGLSGHWMEPVREATIGPRQVLTAWPTPGRGDESVDRVSFRATWTGGEAALCSAEGGDAEDLWSCVPDLASAGVPPGPVELTFDVVEGASVTRDADTLSVTYAASEPKVSWSGDGTRQRAHIPFGEPVKLAAKVRDASELRFMVWYAAWADPGDARTVDGFDRERARRVLAVCRPKGVIGDPATHPDCRWQGDTTSATVRFDWDPTKAERRRSFPDQPKRRRPSRRCRPTACRSPWSPTSRTRRVRPRLRQAAGSPDVAKPRVTTSGGPSSSIRRDPLRLATCA
jgi:hypothetical protein